MKVKLSTLLVGGVLLSLLSFTYASPTKQRQVKGSRAFIETDSAWATREQQQKELVKDDEIEQALAELFSEVLEEQVKAQGDAGESEVAENEQVFKGFSWR